MNKNRTILLSLAFVVFTGTVSARRATAAELFRYTRVYADSSGVSHFSDAEMALAPVSLGEGLPSIPASTRISGTGFRLFCFPAGKVVDWHAAPRRQFYFVLSGEIEMEVTDGEVRRFGPGSVLLGESIEGPGVRARWKESERGCVAVLPLTER